MVGFTPFSRSPPLFVLQKDKTNEAKCAVEEPQADQKAAQRAERNAHDDGVLGTIGKDAALKMPIFSPLGLWPVKAVKIGSSVYTTTLSSLLILNRHLQFTLTMMRLLTLGGTELEAMHRLLASNSSLMSIQSIHQQQHSSHISL
ncbi:hypothetical protein TYRP_010354 [Tyrophagus putrescentiae]|nr:hypothetical protein TYRP_010354 [Tyrophagus putrescentiae]